ncbi:conserved hypothetical low temperature-induced protein [Calothrix sp. NIES-4101]|nr:conserved hypothetical low temperature-induced protein [Calothrix sp. NIES-4101]
MNFARLTQSVVRSFRFIIATALCLTLLFSNVLPASANSTSRSADTDATSQLNKIQEKTDKIGASKGPDLEETQAETQNGLNEVQGDADKDKMFRPSNSQNATSIENQVENFLEKATGKK